MVGSARFPHNDQYRALERRRLLRWLGATSLILPGALAACADSIPPRQYERTPSHITAKSLKD